MFVAAFPLAPFFALINNILEIRVDAYNYVHNYRRPWAQRAEDIGAWYPILATLTKISVFINACVLAFTSELIPQLVYRYTASPDGSTRGYVDWSLSRFPVSNFDAASQPLNATANGIPVQVTILLPIPELSTSLKQPCRKVMVKLLLEFSSGNLINYLPICVSKITTLLMRGSTGSCGASLFQQEDVTWYYPVSIIFVHGYVNSDLNSDGQAFVV